MIDNITIDVMVSTHGRVDLTAQCVTALCNQTKNPFNLIIVDDTEATKKYGGLHPVEPDDGTHDYVLAVQKTKPGMGCQLKTVIYVEAEQPFKSGNAIINAALARSTSPYFATVMNSVVVQPDWDVVGVQVLDGNKQIGGIGFKNLLANNTIECISIAFPEDTKPWHLPELRPGDLGGGMPTHLFCDVHEVPGIQWAFAMFRREAMVGNLSEDTFHGFVGWDDIDNSLVLRSKGWKIYYCGLGAGYHHQHATRGGNDVLHLRLNSDNMRVFHRRWGLYKRYLEEQTKMDVSTRIQPEIKHRMANVTVEVNVLNKLLEEEKAKEHANGSVTYLNNLLKQKLAHRKELLKQILVSLDVDPKQYSLTIRGDTDTWVLLPRSTGSANHIQDLNDLSKSPVLVDPEVKAERVESAIEVLEVA